MTDIWRAAALSGHRDLTSQQGRWLRNELIRLAVKLRTDHGTTTAMCGMAYGADTHFGFAALGAGLDLHAHIPYPQQSDMWASKRQRELKHPSRRQQEWRDLNRGASCHTTYGDLADVPEETRRAVAIQLLRKRNEGMVGAARSVGGVLLIIWDGRRSGARGRSSTRSTEVARRPCPSSFWTRAHSAPRWASARGISNSQPKKE